jgi:septal ring factor EnvC (AmiA/AmiB activator)
MSDHNHKRLEDAIARRDRAARKVQQLQGKLSAAEESVAEIEAECAERGVPPDKLDAAITQLEKRYTKAVTVFEQDIADAEGKLAPFMQEDR